MTESTHDSKIDSWYKPGDGVPLEGCLVSYGYVKNSHDYSTWEYVVVRRVDGDQVGVRIFPGLEELPFRVDAGETCRIESFVEEKGPVPRYRYLVRVSDLGKRDIPLLLRHREMLARVTK